MRFFASASYNGAQYFGWQQQPNQISVQETIDQAFSTILNTPIQVTGCGRTDTGVHAKYYVFHFDTTMPFPEHFLFRLNRFLPKDIVIHDIRAVRSEAHARFDAYQRSYEYYLTFEKDPFSIQTAYYFPRQRDLDLDLMQEAAGALLKYDAFFPFCKTNHDAKTMFCQLSRSEWEFGQDRKRMVFHITSNRFLRGMVRLIVGMCLNVGLKKFPLEVLHEAMEEQKRLHMSTSVPPEGLFLTSIRYPDDLYLPAETIHDVP